jgi:hypothetical protein
MSTIILNKHLIEVVKSVNEEAGNFLDNISLAQWVKCGGNRSAESLDALFTWADTPQGNIYWKEIHYKLLILNYELQEQPQPKRTKQELNILKTQKLTTNFNARKPNANTLPIQNDKLVSKIFSKQPISAACPF